MTDTTTIADTTQEVTEATQQAVKQVNQITQYLQDSIPGLITFGLEVLAAVGRRDGGETVTVADGDQQGVAGQSFEQGLSEQWLCEAAVSAELRSEHPLGKAVEGGDADAAAQENRVVPGFRQVKSVAKAREHIQLLSRDAADQVVGAAAHHPDQKQQGAVRPGAHGDGAAQKAAGQLDIHKLARGGDGAGVAGENQLIGVVRELPGVLHGEKRLFHRFSSCLRSV